jgi:hyperosmotically inducible protein
MNYSLYPLIFGIAVLVAACNRQEAVPATNVATTPYAASAVAVTSANSVTAAPTSAVTVTPASTTVGTEIDDTVVTTKVKSALLSDQDIKGFDIKVETRKGIVLLSGFVDNQARADRAMLVARAVEGVKGIENNMTIKDGKVTVGNKVDDGIVTAKVKSALLSDPSVKSIDIAVVTRKGEVQLSGFVDSQTQIDRAIAVTRAVEGVQNVVNQMSIKK